MKPLRVRWSWLVSELGEARVALVAFVATAVVGAVVLAPWAGAQGKERQLRTGPVEVVSLRDARSKTLQQPDGSFSTRVSRQSLHWFDRREKVWRDIDTELAQSPKQGVGFETGKDANRFSVELAEDSSRAEGLVSFVSRGGRMSLALVGAAAAKQGVKARENAVSFKDVLADVDVEYVVLPDGLKENIVLRKPGASSSYRFRLTPGAGERWRVEERGKGGEWAFHVNGDPEPEFILLPPVVGDSAGVAVKQPESAVTAPDQWSAAHGMASMSVEKQEDGSFVAVVQIDEKWLSDPAREFPVVLDPTVYSQPDVADAEYNTTAGGNPIAASTIRTGRNGVSPAAKYASVLTFDLGSVPPSAKVLDSRLNLYLDSCFPAACAASYTGDVEVRRLTSGWSLTTPWASVTKDPALLDKVSFTAAPVAGWQLWSSGALTAATQNMVNGTTANYGLILERAGGTDDKGYTWRSSLYSDPSFAPYLEVHWVSDGVQVDPESSVHANGADLTWQHYPGGTSAYADSVFADTPLAYWRLDEPAGSTSVLDWSGNDNTGTVTGTVSFGVPGNLADLDTAATFNGSTGKSSATGVNVANVSFTVEAWLRRGSIGTDDYAVGQGSQATNQGLHFGFRASNVFTCAFYANDLNTPAYTDTNWHHWACTYDAATNARKIYRDGALVASDTASADYAGTGAMTLGTAPVAGWFHGDIDEVAIYPAALPEADLDDHIAKAAVPMPGFKRYEVHRSATAGSSPSASTLIATIKDVAWQTYRDTTAKAGGTFYYEVVTVTDEGGESSFSSNEVKMVLPAAGQAKVTIQPGYISTAAKGTHISSATPTSNYGNSQFLTIGSTGTNHTRTLLEFDLRAVPTGVTVSNAEIQLYALQTVAASAVNSHRVTTWFTEGGATWNKSGNGTNNWTTPGGDFDAAATGTNVGGTGLHWETVNVTGMVQDWVNATKPALGTLMKYGSENGSQATLNFAADGFARSVALRPRLVVTFQDGSQAVSPSVAVSQPAAGDLVKGSVTVKAGALDDGSVSKVEFFDGAAQIGSADTTPPFEVSWVTSGRGSSSLTAKATDEAGNVTTSTAVAVTRANSSSPTTSISSATAGGGGVWTVNANASDDVAVTSVDFYVDDVRFASDTTSPYSVSLDTLAFPVYDGSRTLTSKALDADGNVTTSAAYPITVANTSGTKYKAAISTSNVPLEVRYDPNGVPPAFPAASVVEDFNQANGILSSTNWNTPDNSCFDTNAEMRYISNQGGYTTGSCSAATYKPGPWVNEEIAIDVPAWAGGRVYLHVRTQSNTNSWWDGSYFVWFDADGDEIRVYNPDDFAVLLSVSVAMGDGDSIGIRIVGDQLSVHHKPSAGAWAQKGVVTVSDPDLTGAGYLGVELTNTATRIDNLRAGQVSTTGAQEQTPLTVSLTNNSTVNWPTASTKLRYQWLTADATPTVVASGDISIGADLGAGGNRNVSVSVDPPTPPAGVYRARYRLRLDLYDTGATSYFAAKGNQPYETFVTVTKLVSDELGLERYQMYDGEDLGGGFDNTVNLANGNNIVQWVPFNQPGRGINTVVSLTYNSLEHGSVSPLGNNWSLGISSLTPFGLPLDIHPNAADTAAGRTQKWVGFTDGDGSYHVFTGNAAGTYYTAPAGVHLYLKQTGGTGWELWKPDRTRFVYDTAGFPTKVADANGNELSFTLATPAAGEDAFALAKRISAVTDAGGRAFTIAYWSKAEVAKQVMRGKIKSLTDHVGHKLEFSYYEDGNLRSITEKGGPGDDGMPTPDRTVFFNYTNVAGTGPAIATLPGRQNPFAGTTQSLKLFSVIDFKGQETQFEYQTSGANQWRVTGRTNRMGTTADKTTFAYPTSTTTTVTMPLARVWNYTFDSSGRATQITNPLNQTTQVQWTTAAPLNHVFKVIQPTTKFTEYGYNANGYKTLEKDELGNTTTFTYQDIAVDANDVTGNWEAGRSIGNISQLASVVKPRGNATSGNPTDYKWTFTYTQTPGDSTTGLVKTVTDPLGNVTSNTWNANGTLASQTLPANGDGITRTTTYNTYDANGLPTKVTDAAGGVAEASYRADGGLILERDPNHASASGMSDSDSSHHYYDAYGREIRSSMPKSTAVNPGWLVWDTMTYDANDNPISSQAPHYGRGDGANGAVTTSTYDATDRETLVTGPRAAADGGPTGARTEYDAAGRVTKSTNSKGVNTTPSGQSFANDYTTETTYDLLDRRTAVTQYVVDGSGNIDTANSRTSKYCYDLAGDLRSVTGPKGAAGLTSCPNPAADPYVYTSATHTTKFEYDGAHRQTKTTDAAGNVVQTGYDENGQTTSSTDELNKQTTITYNDRGERASQVEPFDTGRTLTSKLEYDNLGNLKRLISPRAFDAAGGGSTYTDYVESYSYDALNRQITTTLPFLASSYQTEILGDTPAAYWRLGETSGTTAADTSGNGKTLTYTNGPSLGQPGALPADANTAPSFDGVNDTATRTPVVTTTLGDVSLEAWAYRTASSTFGAILYNGNSGTNGYGIILNNGSCGGGDKITILLGGISCAATGSSVSMPAATWVHIVAVRQSGTWTLYINGVASGTGTTAPAAPNGTTTIGGTGTSYFGGKVDEAAIYTRALTATEIESHFQYGLATQQAYRHSSYDPNGQLLWTSLATTSSTPAGVTADEKTVNTYWDTGSIYTSQDPANPKVRFDYTAEGWQTARIPEIVGKPGFLDYSRAMYWRYLPDGLTGSLLDEAGERAKYSYDANGNRTNATEATGLVQVGQAPLPIDLTYNTLDELTKVRTPKTGTANYMATYLTYDLHGNTATLEDNREETSGGSQVTAGRLFTYTYNNIDQPTNQTDNFSTTGTTTDDEQITYTYTAKGQLDTQTLQKNTGSWVTEQSATRTYFDNGLTKTLTNKNNTGAMVEQHTLGYITANQYLNGNRVQDVFQLKGPDATAPCYNATCTAGWMYDARERLVREDPGTGATTAFVLDAIGNVTTETPSTGSAITRTYNGQQLSTQTTGTTTHKFFYDSLGNQDCKTTSSHAGASCPTSGNDLLEDWAYDYKNRLSGYASYNGSGGVVNSASYTNDPLDRPITQVSTESGVGTTTYNFTYVGVTNAVSKEILTGANASTKIYAYDAFGKRATIVHTVGSTTNRYSYLYDPHTSVSVLIDQIGAVKEAYGYSAYGVANAVLTKTASGFSNRINPYRYTGKRLDTGSGTLDMGARRYSPGTSRFLQFDTYGDALASFELAADPLSQNRYSLAGSNPTNFVEVDGHKVMPDLGGVDYGAPGVGWQDCTKNLPPGKYRDACLKDHGSGYVHEGDAWFEAILPTPGGPAKLVAKQLDDFAKATAKVFCKIFCRGGKNEFGVSKKAFERVVRRLESLNTGGRSVVSEVHVFGSRAGSRHRGNPRVPARKSKSDLDLLVVIDLQSLKGRNKEWVRSVLGSIKKDFEKATGVKLDLRTTHNSSQYFSRMDDKNPVSTRIK
ncbi:MAG: LamG-like jellyroll fold domain-containing protein [Acidimicrobiales bacterium]